MFFGPGHAEGKTRVHHQSNFGARVGSGFQVCGPNRKILGGLPLELARVLAYSIGLPGHVRGVHFVFGFVFLIARLVRGPGTRDFARTCLARRAEGRGGYSYKTLARLALFHVSWPDVSIHIKPLSSDGSKSEMDARAFVKPEACLRS